MKLLLFSIFCISVLGSPLIAFSPEQLPLELQNIPFADDAGLIRDVKRIKVPGKRFCYNASLLPYNDHYKLFFRFDTPVLPPFTSHIGMVSLDKNLDPLETDCQIIDLGSNHAEDPRVFWYNEKIYVSYSNILSKSKIAIHLAELNPLTMETQVITNLDLGIHSVEKNWTPFIAQDTLMYIYYIYPQKILTILAEEDAHFIDISPDKEQPSKRPGFWKRCYGQIRGGTPAVQISDDEYLAFFHSSFLDQTGFCWYIMGAYTFSTKPPYEIQRISQEPILFHSLYDSWTYHREKCCIFPAGLVVEKDAILVSCGENDTCIKIIIFDKEKLLGSLSQATSYRTKFGRFDHIKTYR